MQMDNKELFVEILKENWQHARHIETERMWFANIFAAVIVGAIAYLSKVGLEMYPLWVLIGFAVFCLLVTIKLNAAFATHMKAIESIFSDKKIILGDKEEWRIYMGMPSRGDKKEGTEGQPSKEGEKEIPSRKGLKWKILSVAKLTVFFYSLAIAALLTTIILMELNVIGQT
jgi:hypothetical protein